MPPLLRSLLAHLHLLATRPRHRGLRFALALAGGLLLTLGAISHFWLPGFVKDQLESRLSAALLREVRVAAVTIAPARLAIHVHGLKINDHAGSSTTSAPPALLAFDDLAIDLSAASLARRAPVISAVRLSGLQLHLQRDADGRLNIADLIASWTHAPATPARDKLLFSVSNIQIENGRVIFDDQAKKARHTITDITLGLPFIANFPSAQEAWVQPHFSARVNGAPVRLDAQARPFAPHREATLRAELSGIDLAALDEYAALPEGLSLLSGKLDATLEATFGQPQDGPAQLSLGGKLTAHDVAFRNDRAATPNTLRIEALQLQLAPYFLAAEHPLKATLALKGVAVQRQGDNAPALALASARLETIEVDSARRRIAVGASVVAGLQVALRRGADGRLDITDLFAPKNYAPPTETAPKANPPLDPDTTPQPPPAWSGSMASLRLAAAALRFEDHSLARPVPLTVAPLNAMLTGIDFTGSQAMQVTLDASVNAKGTLGASGRIGWAPLALDLTLDARTIDLVGLQGWAAGRLNALLTRGALNFAGTVKAAGNPLRVALQGDGGLRDVNLLDKANATDLLRWRNLDINGLRVVTEPLKVDAAAIALSDFFAYVRISPTGQLNLGDLVSAPPASHTEPRTETRALPIQIGRITLDSGNVNFDDRFVRPNYQARLTGLRGRIGPLAPGHPGDVDVRGAVNRAAPLEIQGKLDPFGRPLFLDIAASAKGIDLPNLSPYSGKYVGYAIEKGKLSVDLRYHIENGELRADNNIFLDQLTFGDKVDSPDALSIPVHLAVALLKNTRGEIDIHLPVSGSLNDPEFSIGGILAKALVNLVVKAVSSPFALLGSLFGGGAELSTVDFAPGRARPTPEAETALTGLARALRERPGLNLEITGRADPDLDREGLRRAILERKVRAQKMATAARNGQATGSLRDTEITASDYPHYLAQAYAEETFPKPKNALGFTRSLPVTEMERLMLANIPAGDDELHQLAERRANSVRDWLVNTGQVAAEQIFILAPKVEQARETAHHGSRVDFSLR